MLSRNIRLRGIRMPRLLRLWPAWSAVAVAAVLALISLRPSSSAPAFADLNCSDFPNQAAAQANLRANPSDPNGLDRDRDGIACESNRCPCDRVPVDRSG